MGDAILYELKHPITITLRPKGGEEREETISETSVRRPKARDMRLLDRHPGKIAQSLALIGALTKLTPAQIDELDGEDVAGLGEIIGDFFPDGRPTGQTSSET